MKEFVDAVYDNNISSIKKNKNKELLNIIPKGRKYPIIFFSTKHKDCRVLKYFLKLGVNPNSKGKKGFSLLMYASQLGYLNAVKILLKHKKINVNHRGNSGKTALMEAAQKGHLEIVDLLLKNGANPKIKEKFRNKKSCRTRTANNMALACGHKKISKKLKKNKK